VTKYYEMGGERIPYRMGYVGGTACVCGTAVVSLTLPDGANMAMIDARGGAIYYALNDTTAGTTSPGYVPTGTQRVILPIDNLTSLHVSGEAASVAHVQFYNG
jgi:hypothetical protein